MDPIIKFLNNISYKFPKGYPDINDPKDKKMLFEMATSLLEGDAEEAINILNCSDAVDQKLENQIKKILFSPKEDLSEYALREWTQTFPSGKVESFENAKKVLSSAMSVTALKISSMWESDRYVREEFQDIG